MASTMQVLDVLSKLREEVDRAGATESAQRDENRALTARGAALREAQQQSQVKMQQLINKEQALDDVAHGKQAALAEAKAHQAKLDALWRRRQSEESGHAKLLDADLDAFIARGDAFRQQLARGLQRLRQQRARLATKEAERGEAETAAETAARALQDSRDRAAKALEERNAERALIQEGLDEAAALESANTALESETFAIEKAVREANESLAETKAAAAALVQRNRAMQGELRGLSRREARGRTQQRQQ
ncbi:unnamed protein product, partial [Phaeothamnion confervicola]